MHVSAMAKVPRDCWEKTFNTDKKEIKLFIQYGSETSLQAQNVFSPYSELQGEYRHLGPRQLSKGPQMHSFNYHFCVMSIHTHTLTHKTTHLSFWSQYPCSPFCLMAVCEGCPLLQHPKAQRMISWVWDLSLLWLSITLIITFHSWASHVFTRTYTKDHC